MNQNNKGITLVALVITIIVLIILASVSIATLSGPNGILTQANEAKKRTEIAQIVEQVQIDLLSEQANTLSGDISKEKFYEILEKYGTLSGERENMVFTTNKGEYEIKISDYFK